MFLASNICCVSSGTVRALYCCDPRDVRGANPGMKKWRRGKGTMLTANFLRSALSWPGNRRQVVTPDIVAETRWFKSPRNLMENVVSVDGNFCSNYSCLFIGRRGYYLSLEFLCEVHIVETCPTLSFCNCHCIAQLCHLSQSESQSIPDTKHLFLLQGF